MKIRSGYQLSIRIAIIAIVITSHGRLLAKYPDKYDWGLLASGIVLTTSSELFKEELGPQKPRWQNTNALDVGARNSLLISNTKSAAMFSNLLVYGVYVPAMIVVPMLSKQKLKNFMFFAESILLTIAVNQTFKYSFARQRPYSYFGTSPSSGVDDNMSFSSGHTAIAFSSAISMSLILSKQSGNYGWMSWLFSLSGATTVAMLRIAADKHYLTDTIAGAAVGIGSALLVYHFRKGSLSISSTGKGLGINKLLNW